MDESKIFKRLKKSAWENVKYFSNSNKDERECWVVSKFLSILGIDHHTSELHPPEQQSKIDVCFRNAQFQVKELPDPDLLRGRMYKDQYNSIKEVKSLEAVSFVGDVRDVPPIVSIGFRSQQS